MRISARGSRGRPARVARGLTLLELLIVVAIVALSAGVVALALRDGDSSRLDEEAERLVALLEMARAESRVAGTPVRWLPGEGDTFSFVGIAKERELPTRWLAGGTRAQVSSGAFVVLGPQAILPPQRVVLSLGAQRVEVASDGLAPFAISTPGPAR